MLPGINVFPAFDTQFSKPDWTLPRILEHHAATIGHEPFLQWQSEAPHSFSDVNREANRVAHGLVQMGVKKGDRIAIVAPNSLQFVFIWFGCSKIGAVEVPINIAYRGEFLRHQLVTAGCSVLFISADILSEVEDLVASVPGLSRVVVLEGSAERDLGPSLSVLGYDDVVSSHAENPMIDVSPADIGAIIYTSGTTGPSKGVLMPHAQMYFFGECIIQAMKLESDDIYLSTLPLYHANAQFMAIYPSLIMGGLCVLYKKFSASGFVGQLHESGATVTNALGVMLPFVMAQPPSKRDRSHRLRRIQCAPSPAAYADEFEERFGVGTFVEAFGMTEICIPIIAPQGVPKPGGSCGLLNSKWFDVRIVDPDTDELLPDGQVGEAIVRSKEPWTLNAGYIGMPEATLATWRNLWFHTGDALKRDLDGWYYYVDRIKDSIRRRGENISSYEIEAAVRSHPSVLEVAAVAVPADQKGGEDEVMIFVVPSSDALNPPDLIDWCEPNIPAFAVPRYVRMIAELPKTPSEKVQKAELRKIGVDQATWDRLGEHR